MKKITLLILLAVSVSTFAVDTYFVRPTGDATSWSTQATADPTQVLTIADISELTPFLGTSLKVFYLAKGTYTAKLVDETTLTSGYYLKLANGEKVYGGFAGTETTIDLATRALTDRDGNGAVEVWEFLNETVIDGQDGTTLGVKTKRLFSIENSSELNGLSIKNFAYSASTITGGPIFVGSYLASVNGSAAAPSGSNSTTSGSLVNCYIFNLSSLVGQGGAAIMSNSNSVINNCLFEQCQSNSGNNCMGGAVYVLGTGGKIKSSIFRNNKVYFTSGTGTVSRGGAVYGEAYLLSDMNLTIDNSIFYNNSSFASRTGAYGNGGAYRNDAVAGKRGAQIINCTFSNNFNTVTTSGNIELINSGTLVNCINYGGSNGFRANTTNANYYLQNCISTIANLDMAANATSYPTVTFNAATDFGFARTTSFNGAVFPADVDYATKIVEIRKANFSSSKSSSYLATNYGVASLPTSYSSTTPAATINFIGTLPAKDINGADRVLATNTLGAYNFVADVTAPTVAISSSVTADAHTSLGSIPFTVTFNEPVNGFDITDIALTNGVASNFVAANSSVFTFNVAPNAAGAVNVNVAAAVATDFGGNSNAAATQYSLVSDLGTGVSNTQNAGLKIYSVSGDVIFENCKAKLISIYTSNGQLVKTVVATSDKTSVPMAKGFYIVKVDAQGTKLFVK